MIVGHGSIGRAVERRLVPFGVRIGRVARSARPGVEPVERLAEAVERADAVVVLAPLSESTRGLIDAEVIAHMKDGALLVNAGRGPVVDTDALVAAVRAGRIRAALDVTDPEPLPEDHVLWTLDGVFITPHNAGDTPEAEVAAHALARAQMLRYRAGPPAAARRQRARTPFAMNSTSASSSAFDIRLAKPSGMMLVPPPSHLRVGRDDRLADVVAAAAAERVGEVGADRRRRAGGGEAVARAAALGRPDRQARGRPSGRAGYWRSGRRRRSAVSATTARSAGTAFKPGGRAGAGDDG